MRKQQLRRRHPANTVWALALAGTVSVSGLSAPALGQDSGNSLDRRVSLGAPVKDAELAEIRGKFIRPESISYFGISMVTSWQDESGVTTVARLVFDIDFLANGIGEQPVPRLTIGWVRDGDAALDVTDSHEGYTPIMTAQEILPVGGLDATKGIAQANVLSGSGNNALNGLSIALVPASQVARIDTDGLTAIDQSRSEHFADGDVLEFRLGANEIGLLLGANGGSDSTIQSIGGDFGRMLQQTVLNTDGNAVFNSSAIVIGADMNAAAFDAVRATEALSSMKGHGF